MVLHQSSLITLDYEPASDILSLDWPDVKDFLVPEIERELKVLVDTIKHYDVKKLLIDTSKAQVEVNDAAYQAFLSTFANTLKDTRLQKLARVGTSNPEREKITEQAKEASRIDQVMEFQNFNSKTEALAWLSA